jgi:Family of unknown function (DUF5995)/Domain of unknown function (DUF4157)
VNRGSVSSTGVRECRPASAAVPTPAPIGSRSAPGVPRRPIAADLAPSRIPVGRSGLNAAPALRMQGRPSQVPSDHVRADMEAGSGADLAHEVARVVRSSTAEPFAAVPNATGTVDPSDAVVHRGPAVEAALEKWHAGAATVGHRVFLPRYASPEVVRHEAMHLRQARDDVDLGRPVRIGSPVSAEERGTASIGHSDPQVIRRAPPRVETPAWPPSSTPPAAYAPTGARHDSEGNLVEEAAGHWYLASAPRVTFPIARGYRYQLLPPNPNASYTALHRQTERVRDQQLATANRLRGTGRYWFARVYYFVTLHELENIDRGVYQYPHMKMQEVIAFNTTYMNNLHAWESGNQSSVEPNWRRAFAAADHAGSWISASKEIANALLPAMQAHIRFDLPRAIAGVYNTHYAGIPGTSIDDFRADFFAMASVFDRAAADLNPEIEDAGTNWNPANWQWAGDIAFPFIFNVPGEREHAWEKAQIISSAGDDPNLGTKLRTSMTARHPNWSDFEVDGDDVRGYRWGRQPGLRHDEQPGPVHQPAPPVPSIPTRLYFRLGLPDRDMELADAVRRDQDLRPLLDLAHWLRRVTGAVIVFSGHTSSEGGEVLNHNLAIRREDAVEFFLFRASADLTNNRIVHNPLAALGAQPTPEWRYVAITVLLPGVAKETMWSTASRPPSEVP